MIKQVRVEVEKQQEFEKRLRLEDAKERAKKGARNKLVLDEDEACKVEKLERRIFHEKIWSQMPEEILGGEKKDELALQEDFVPL